MRAILRLSDTGSDVEQLQSTLRDRGFNPGTIDGVFGGATQAAVLAFQHSTNLLADGVAGPRTLAALGLNDNDVLPDRSAELNVDVASRMCPFTPLANIKANLPIVVQSLRDHGLHDRAMLLMAVASIRAETESFLPVSEGRSRFNTSPSGHPFDLYDHRADLGNQGSPDGARYRGRGFIQLTGRYNYTRYGERLNPAVNLVEHPELANASSLASDLLSLFLGERERQIKEALAHDDLRTARRLVNGGSHGLDRFSDAYRIGNALLTE